MADDKQIIGWMDVTPSGMAAKGKFARGTRVGNLVFLSGQTAFDMDDKLMGVGSPRAQARNALANIKSLLAVAGAKMSDVVKITVYVTDVSYRPEVYDEIFKAFKGKAPSSTGLVVNGLARKELLVEIDAIAAIADTPKKATKKKR
ncbi:MAG: RidA family protein [Thaumarchaeota archaeon]|nr:RidA family protein [Nitrososphaerota archaeon]